MPLVELDTDILSHICARITSPGALLALSRTCKLLQTVAEPHLLARVTIKRPRRLDAFHDTITKSARAGALVRAFAFPVDWKHIGSSAYRDEGKQEQLARLLADVLNAAPNLVSFELGLARHFLQYQPLQDALLGCTKLSTLTLGETENDSYEPCTFTGMIEVLQQVTAPLKCLNISINRAYIPLSQHPFAYLANFASSLESLTITGSDLDEKPYGPSLPVFPRLSSFTLHYSEFKTATLERAFPNLRRLTVLSHDEISSYEETHDLNRQHRVTRWAALEHLEGGIAGVWSLGLVKLRVDSLVFVEGPKDTHEGQACSEIVKATSPRHLKIAANEHDVQYSQNMIKRAAKALITLRLEVTTSQDQRPSDVPSATPLTALETLRPTLLILTALEEFALIVHGRSGRKRKCEHSVDLWRGQLVQHQLDCFAISLIEEMPSARRVRLECWIGGSVLVSLSGKTMDE